MTETGSQRLQFAAAAAANLYMLVIGVILGWTSPILPKLEKDNPLSPDNPLGRSISRNEGSWIGSLLSLGTMFGCIIAGYLAKWQGPKRALLITTVPFIIGWILLITAKDIVQIYVGRFILGLCVAVPYTVVPMYAGEISEVSIRGALGSFLQLFVTFGFVFTYSVGPYASYVTYCTACACLHLVSFAAFVSMPESPYFLLSKGRNVEATKALARFRGKSPSAVKKEIESIQKEIDEDSETTASWGDICRDKVNRKTLLIMCAVMCFMEFMGIDVVLFYAENIFIEAGVDNTAVSTIILGVFQVLASIISPLIVDRTGRKIMLIVSSVGVGIALAVLGAIAYLKSIDFADTSGIIRWVPLISLLVFICFLGFGWGSVPWVIAGEIFSPTVKSKASATCVFSLSMFSFLLTKFSPNIDEAYGAYITFWIFSVSCIINIVFVIVVMPETKGKTLHEIQQDLRHSAGKKSVQPDDPDTFASSLENNDGRRMYYINPNFTE